MKILFTILSIKTSNTYYLGYAYKLINELLRNTPHDILLTTNNLDYFQNIKNKRVLLRNIVPNDVLLEINGEFNYNLKYLCFKNIPKNYDVIFYLDCDIKNTFWNSESDNIVYNLMKKYNCIGTRFGCILGDEIKSYAENNKPLFTHKIESYNILNWKNVSKFYKACLPSEHFLILKYSEYKLNRFSNKWRLLNYTLQNTNNFKGFWGDGFEIGISLEHSKYTKRYNLDSGELSTKLGFVFNGNKI
jgi:hypothetical protein